MATREEIDEAILRGESPKSKKAYLDFLALGPSRTLKMLLDRYRDPALYSQTPRTENYPPTRQMKKLQIWSVAFKWHERINHVHESQIETIVREEERQLLDTMKEKYASRADRVQALSKIAVLLMTRVENEGIETVIVKQVGAGKNTQMVEERQVDVNLISSLRGVLGDLAAETGGRAKRVIAENQGGPLIENRTIFLLPAVDSIPGTPIPLRLNSRDMQGVDVIDVPGFGHIAGSD